MFKAYARSGENLRGGLGQTRALIQNVFPGSGENLTMGIAHVGLPASSGADSSQCGGFPHRPAAPGSGLRSSSCPGRRLRVGVLSKNTTVRAVYAAAPKPKKRYALIIR